MVMVSKACTSLISGHIRFMLCSGCLQGINLFMEAVVQDQEFVEQAGTSGNGGTPGRKAYIVLETWDYDQIVHQSVSTAS